MFTIIEETEGAVLEAIVTVAADRTARAADLAETVLSRECRKIGKVAAIGQYKITKTEPLPGMGGSEYTFHFGTWDD